MIGIRLIKNSIQEYPWGSRTFIPELRGELSPSNTPQAELWMGAHPKAPSEVQLDGRNVSLLELLQHHAVEILGERVTARYGERLPFLFKVLAAEEPLSIQAHPYLHQAKEGFARENAAKTPIDAFARNYRDANHKPEIIVALTEFWAFNGLRAIGEIIDSFERIGAAQLVKVLHRSASIAESKELLDFLRTLLSLDTKEKSSLIEASLKHAEKILPKDKDSKWEWFEKLHGKYRNDIGVLAPLFLNLVFLKPGDALFLKPGELHAYLRGAGIELMANSDNVLRCGLTQKHVDVNELLKVINAQSLVPALVEVQRINRCEKLYITPAQEFQLTELQLEPGNYFTANSDRNIEIIICIDGEGVIEAFEGPFSLPFGRGQSFLIPASVAQYRMRGNARLFKATVPPR